MADEERLGIMGWSYGGYLTAWAVTQTSRFKAASIGAGPTNLVSLCGTIDLNRFVTDYFNGDFLHHPEIYAERSPINFADRIETPCLIQHGTSDLRVPVSQSYEFYHALKRHGKDAVLVLYPDMAHMISEPALLADAMERNLDWFQKNLNAKT